MERPVSDCSCGTGAVECAATAGNQHPVLAPFHNLCFYHEYATPSLANRRTLSKFVCMFLSRKHPSRMHLASRL